VARPEKPGWSRTRFLLTFGLSLILLVAAIYVVAVLNTKA
jgi:hypothetical protein